MCNHCRSDWQGDIDCDAEIFREAELSHADNEHLADEVLGRNLNISPKPPSSESIEFLSDAQPGAISTRSDVGAETERSAMRKKRRSSILGLLAK